MRDVILCLILAAAASRLATASLVGGTYSLHLESGSKSLCKGEWLRPAPPAGAAGAAAGRSRTAPRPAAHNMPPALLLNLAPTAAPAGYLSAQACGNGGTLSLRAAYTPAAGLQLWQVYPPGGPVAAPTAWEDVAGQPLLIRSDGRTRPGATCHSLLSASATCTTGGRAGAGPCNTTLGYSAPDLVYLAGTWNPNMWVQVPLGRRRSGHCMGHAAMLLTARPALDPPCLAAPPLHWRRRKFVLNPVNATGADGLFRISMHVSSSIASAWAGCADRDEIESAAAAPN